MSKIVLTGTAFAGKTTLINLLAEQGYQTIPEAARDLIEQNQKIGSQSLPWIDLDLFLVDLLHLQLEREAKIQDLNQPIFIDRSPIDQYAYFRYFNKSLTPEYRQAFETNRYDKVFLLETLPGYQTDEIRKEPLEMVQQLRILHQETYQELGYHPILIPVTSIKNRLKYLEDHF